MGAFLFIFVGIVPVSAPAFGYLLSLTSLDTFLVATGTLLVLISIGACCNQHLRQLSY